MNIKLKCNLSLGLSYHTLDLSNRIKKQIVNFFIIDVHSILKVNSNKSHSNAKYSLISRFSFTTVVDLTVFPLECNGA